MPTSNPAAVPQASKPPHAWPVRAAAALIALVAWTGLAAGCVAVFGRTGSAGQTLWIMTRYFTNTTGLALALLFTALALGGRPAAGPWLLAAASLMALLVGIVQRLLLHGLRVRQGPDLLADMILHVALPVLVPLFWLVFAQKGRLRWRDPLLWMLYPLAYLAWALVRGTIEGRYAYPFINVARLGWMPVFAYAAAIMAGFLLCGTLLVLLDRRLAAVSAKPTLTDR